MGQPNSRQRREEWTDEELAYLDRVQQDIAGPLTEYQLTVLRRWWNGGYRRSRD
ncbi:hypothetical protein [Nocardia araoensis]|uniref:hypothetical protein n=1 Tax=Nocardia araoensis TaxID=228600 RepID=UPI0002D71F58|nr:hypothetical protein [Nocardia araoensis]